MNKAKANEIARHNQLHYLGLGEVGKNQAIYHTLFQIISNETKTANEHVFSSETVLKSY